MKQSTKSWLLTGTIFFFLNDNENYTKRLFCIYTYFKKRCRGEGRLQDRNELGVPFVMQNFTICAAHAYACVASENLAFQLVYPFLSKGIATQVKFCIGTHSSFRSCNPLFSRQRCLK